MFCDDASLEKVITALKEEKDGHPYETISLYIYKNAASWITKEKKKTLKKQYETKLTFNLN